MDFLQMITPELFAQRIAELRQIIGQIKATTPRAPLTMPTFNFGKRESLTELRPRHLLLVEELGLALRYSRSRTHRRMIANYDELFGPLRDREGEAQPSDAFRKELMVRELLDLIDMRRAEISDRERREAHRKYQALRRTRK
jgi:hypothetical protein